jgi:phosphoribosylamine-glycine ligase
MKNTNFLLLALVFVASMAFAQGAEVLTIKGTIIDNQCAGTKDAQQLGEFIKTHTKECALACAPSGYAIVNNGFLIKFDKESNAKVEEFLKKTDSKLDVIIEAKQAGEELSLVSIKNQ